MKKRTVGQPKLFETAKQLQDLMIAYLEKCEENEQMPNRAGFCTDIKISRDSYYEYRKKAEYSDTIKTFEQATENKWVQRLNSNSPTGAIFYLKNAFREDYKDKHETDITSGGKVIQSNVITFTDFKNETDSDSK